MTGYVVGLAGMWLFSDAVYSILLYLTAPGYDGKPKQTWARDHSIRVIRGLLAIILVVIGGSSL